MARSKTVAAPVIPAQPPRYFVVNPGGAVHEVTEAHRVTLLRRTGWRDATSQEVTELERRGGSQSADDPIG